MRHYRVAAENTTTPNDGRGPFSASVSVMTRPAGVPAASTALTGAAVGTQTVELEWAPPVDGRSSITGYRIERSTNSGTTWDVAAADTGKLRVNDLGTAGADTDDRVYYSDTHSSLAGKSVIYRVAGMNNAGMGVYSANSASVTLPKAGTQPGAPTGLTVTPTSFTGVTISWNAPSSPGASAIDAI